MKNQYGFSTIINLILLTLLTTIIMSCMNLVNVNFATEELYLSNIQAQYLAKAGANYAIVKLIHNKEYAKENNSGIIETIEFSTGKCEIRVYNTGGKASILAVGISQKARSQYIVEMQVGAEEKMHVVNWRP
ncbi:hypothetical protein [Anaerosinus gibii]|uniref:Uncharacterized protein n=1 Tax=Selenobaculum gibii TaxID=3054208 RepID=A0A9Y2EVX7_9FIRM|nr:hypothetical protein [Selenobaculum gbiensis]WIW71839.1 hypothetical protein P3F81_05975 [Selenobaculum gbiensis]